MSEPKTAAGLAYREAVPEGWSAGDPVALLVHGFPESSYAWHALLPALAKAGFRAVAPDLAGFGDSPPHRPGTWEHHVDSLEELRNELGFERAALIVHDWGSLIGLRWACDHPDAVNVLVISNGGFFSDGRWHALGVTMRTEGEGEQVIDAFTREGFGGMMGGISTGITPEAVDEYWKCLADKPRRRAVLELYRSGDFEKLVPYEGRLAALAIPTLILWGRDDPFAPLAGGERFRDEIPGSRLVVIDGAGHFVWEDAPQRTAEEVVAFLSASG